MPYADKEDGRAAWKRWYQNNKKKEFQRVKARLADLKTQLRELKASLGCSRCSETHPACLQFHHLNPRKKVTSLSNALRDGWSMDRMQKEIKKCILLCANCHFKEHDRG